jgi:hypothetical protein
VDNHSFPVGHVATCGKQGAKLRSATSSICLSPAGGMGKACWGDKGGAQGTAGWRSPRGSLR